MRLVEAAYDDEFFPGVMRTYCTVWLLEKVKWRRRKTARVWGNQGEDPLRPQWGDEFDFFDVREDAKVVIDVWNTNQLVSRSNQLQQGDGERDQFIGKVTLRLEQLMLKPADAWHELVPGRIHLQLNWTELTATGDVASAPVALT